MNEQSPPRKLTRSRDDRYIGGVAAGLASYLKVDPIFIRIAFVATLALGGLGLLAYVVLLAVMPVEGDPAKPLPPIEPKRRNLMIGLAVAVGIVGIATAGNGDFAGWLFGFWPGTLFGILFWSAAAIAGIWLLASGALAGDHGSGPEAEAGSKPSFPDSEPRKPDPSTEVVTYAESPTQLSTEVMETRQMYARAGDGGRGEGGRPDGPGEGPGPDGPRGPASGSGSATPPKDDGSGVVGKIMVWFAIGLSALTAFCILFVISAGTTALFGGVPMAALVILLGGGMIFAGVRGRRQISLWLLTAAIAITLPMAAVSIADLRIEGSYGDIKETPLTIADIPDDGYRMAAGNMTIDLRKFDFDRIGAKVLQVQSGFGLTSIIVPDDVCVDGEVVGKAGVANIRGRQSSGISINQSAPRPAQWKRVAVGGKLLFLDANFKLGAFEVVDNTQWRADGRAGSFDENDLEPDSRAEAAARERATAACSGPFTRTIVRDKTSS